MRALIVLLLSLLFAVAGCVAPSPSAQAGGEARAGASPQPVSQDPTQQPSPTGAQPQKPRVGRPIKMPPISDPLPPERVQAPSPTPTQVDRNCTIDNDCVVKDVGNCCGYYPACVHKDSPTDPAGVRARCAKSGMASVCGFEEITACRCVRNQCIGVQEPVGGWIDDPAPTPPVER